MLPLTGIKVLDLSQVMAGPYCCMLLGDMGADVIKVEPPESGDQTRRAMGYRLKGEDSNGFMQLNRNKRSMTLNLKSEEGRQILYRLIDSADVLVENGRPGVSKRLGYDYDTVRTINPGLVYASISGFGQSGEWAGRPGYDMIAQAMSGVMSVCGHADSSPVRNSVSIADLGAGMMALYGILAALLGRTKSGTGQFVDASLFEAALGLSIWEVAEYWCTGVAPVRIGSANRMSAPYQVVRAADDHFVIGAANQKLWGALCTAIDAEHLREKPQYATNSDRLHNRSQLIDDLEKIFRGNTVDHWVKALLKEGVPAAPIYDYGAALASDHTRTRNMVLSAEHPVEGEIKLLGFPVKLGGTPQKLRYPPPLLGQHTHDVLTEIGMSEDEISALMQIGTFGKPPRIMGAVDE